MLKKLHKGYRNSINSRLKTFANNFNHPIHHPIHHKRRSNNEVYTYYFVAYSSNKGKVFITAYSNNSYCINQIISKCASKKGKLVDVKILLPKDAQNYSWELQNKLKDTPFNDIKGAEWKEHELKEV